MSSCFVAQEKQQDNFRPVISVSSEAETCYRHEYIERLLLVIQTIQP